jgi:RHS repeat-associated protein
VREVTDVDGAVLARYEYDPWGKRTDAVAGATPNPGFAGYFGVAPDLSIAWHRAYDSNLGRWLSPDPAGLVDGPNLFAYVHSNPVSLVDSTGLASGTEKECGPCITRVESDPHKGKHAHWTCPGSPQGCVKPNGDSCEGSPPPPRRIRDCLEKRRFFRPVPFEITVL